MHAGALGFAEEVVASELAPLPRRRKRRPLFCVDDRWALLTNGSLLSAALNYKASSNILDLSVVL